MVWSFQSYLKCKMNITYSSYQKWNLYTTPNMFKCYKCQMIYRKTRKWFKNFKTCFSTFIMINLYINTLITPAPSLTIESIRWIKLKIHTTEFFLSILFPCPPFKILTQVEADKTDPLLLFLSPRPISPTLGEDWRLSSQSFQNLSSTGESVTTLPHTDVEAELADAQLAHHVLLLLVLFAFVLWMEYQTIWMDCQNLFK